MTGSGMSVIHPASLPAEQLVKDCDLRRTRRSGPGGQHRNKVETAVVLTHRSTGIVAEAAERRSPSENRAVAIFRLRINLALGVRCPVVGTSPSALWQSRCRGVAISVNPRHDDFPSMLAEALDVLASRDNDLRSAAEFLGCTPSQLTKLLQQEPRAIAMLNEVRVAAGLHRLR